MIGVAERHKRTDRRADN